MRRLPRAGAAVALMLTGVLCAPAQAHHGCTMAGPAPDAQVVAFDLAQPMELALRLTADPPPGGASSSGWHVTSGFAILERDTRRVLATRALSAGSAPPSLHARVPGGPEASADVPAPLVPFRYDHGTSIPILPRGRYIAVGFVVDGGAAAPFGRWAAELQGDRPLRCYPAGTAAAFELDQRDFTDGLQVGSPVAGVGSGGQLAVGLPHQRSFGVLVAVAAAGSAELAAHGPTGQVGSVENDIGPFAAGAGRHQFVAAWSGAGARIGVAGATYVLSEEPARWS
jgi:hypothetical protein